ncbi:HI0074 family nucleotidyltransferase substrate-binding subunit [Thermoanaerobacter thermocopriae]|uniref:HI0074 family nucleotidyltransferase substrate-binding subunit n=1 Tax=Thermoanaerobacter thermocopriae TaxID=29350 RepID=UPI0004B2F450|nr:HI0074 family nucleotidyltransferase substrate-binding subunit [Thermoanaerobacter thermocopriae]
MRERVEKFFNDFAKAFENLKKATEVAKDDLDIDGTIKRFELCYELAWKLMKEYLADLGIIVKSPREAFKQAFINESY